MMEKKENNRRAEWLRAFERLIDVQYRLRQDCPWDRKQTFESLRPNTIEEVYELADALARGDKAEIMKELGDVMEHVVFYAMLGDETGDFDIADVCNHQSDKLMFRHTFIDWNDTSMLPEGAPAWSVSSSDMAINDKGQVVYRTDLEAERRAAAEGKPATALAVEQTWEQVKQRERDGNKSVLSGVPDSLPSIIKAYRVQDKARNVGFDWEKPADVWDKVREELGELEAELKRGDHEASEHELGDFLFSVINAARLYRLNPDNAISLSAASTMWSSRPKSKDGRSKNSRWRRWTDCGTRQSKRKRNKNKHNTNMRKITLFMAAMVALFVAVGCDNKPKEEKVITPGVEGLDTAENDSTIYGKLIDGGMNSMILLTDDGDTLELLRNPDDTLEVVKGGIVPNDRYAVIAYSDYGDRFIRTAINIESLKGRWSSLDRDFEIKDDGTVTSAVASETNAWKSWVIRNGQLVLGRDTFVVDELGADSMLLENREGIYSFKRGGK